jgi:squalene cyclase
LSVISSEIEAIVAAQNPDGGWGYRGGASWTEPTAFALLALSGDVAAEHSLRRGREWLRLSQRSDGGFAPRPSIEESTWVTALPVLLGMADREAERRAIRWLLRQSGEDTTLLHRFREWILGAKAEYEQVHGWSWYPGTAAWVVPTSLTLLAIRKAQAGQGQPGLADRLDQGRRFLLSRRCEDGGWNHGSSRALGYQAVSYPETTGLALLALAGEHNLGRSLAKAELHYRDCRSREGRSWIELAFLAHGRPLAPAPDQLPARTLLDAALGVVAAKARAGRNLFLEPAV